MQAIRQTPGNPEAAAVLHAGGDEVQQRSPSGYRVERMCDPPVRDHRGHHQHAGSYVVPRIIGIREGKQRQRNQQHHQMPQPAAGQEGYAADQQRQCDIPRRLRNPGEIEIDGRSDQRYLEDTQQELGHSLAHQHGIRLIDVGQQRADHSYSHGRNGDLQAQQTHRGQGDPGTDN